MSPKAFDHLPRAVRETLDAVVSEGVRDRLLSQALAEFSAAEIPIEPEAFTLFVDGPLRRALAQALGDALSESVLSELERVAGIRRSSDTPPRRRAGSAPVSPRRRNTPSRRVLTPPGVRLGALRTDGPARPVSEPARDAAPSGPVGSGPTEIDRAERETARPPAATDVGEIALLDLDGDLFRPEASTPGSWPARAIRTGSGPIAPPSSRDYPQQMPEAWRDAIVTGTSDAPVSSERLPRVFVVSRDAELIRRLSNWLDPRLMVVRVKTLVGMLQDLDDAQGARSVIVLDCRQPSIRPVAIAAVAEELPLGTKVLLFASRPELETELFTVNGSTREWFNAEDGDLVSIASRCLKIVG